jgi:hypothetical protein
VKIIEYKFSNHCFCVGEQQDPIFRLVSYRFNIGISMDYGTADWKLFFYQPKDYAPERNEKENIREKGYLLRLL